MKYPMILRFVLWRCICTFYSHPICGGRTDGGRGGFLIGPPGALQFTRDLCKSLAESTNHVDKTRTFAETLGDLEMVWKILRLCLQPASSHRKDHYVSLRTTKSRITSPTRKLSYFGIFLLIAPCFWMHTSSVQHRRHLQPLLLSIVLADSTSTQGAKSLLQSVSAQ